MDGGAITYILEKKPTILVECQLQLTRCGKLNVQSRVDLFPVSNFYSPHLHNLSCKAGKGINLEGYCTLFIETEF